MSPAFLCKCCLLRYRSDRRYLPHISPRVFSNKRAKKIPKDKPWIQITTEADFILPRICRWEPHSIVFCYFFGSGYLIRIYFWYQIIGYFCVWQVPYIISADDLHKSDKARFREVFTKLHAGHQAGTAACGWWEVVPNKILIIKLGWLILINLRWSLWYIYMIYIMIISNISIWDDHNPLDPWIGHFQTLTWWAPRSSIQMLFPLTRWGCPRPPSGSMLWAMMAMVPGGFPGPGHDCFVSASRESPDWFWRFVTAGHSHELTGAFWIEFARDESCSHFIIRFCRFLTHLTLHKKSRGFTRLSDSGETSTNSSSCGRPQEWARPSPKKLKDMMHHDAIHVPCMLHHPVLSCTMLWCFLMFSELTAFLVWLWNFWTQKKMEGVCQQHPDHGQRLEPRHGTVFLLAALLRCCTASHVRECYVNAGTMVTPTSCGTWTTKSGLGWVAFSFVMFTLSSSVRHLSFRHLLACLYDSPDSSAFLRLLCLLQTLHFVHYCHNMSQHVTTCTTVRSTSQRCNLVLQLGSGHQTTRPPHGSMA